MSELKVKVEKAPDGVVKGALGALLTNYGSDSEENSDEESNDSGDQQLKETLPNPLFAKPDLIVANPCHEGGRSELTSTGSSFPSLKVKEEPKDSDSCEEKVSDFSNLCAAGGGNGSNNDDLTVADFLDTYNSARTVKIEVASDSSDSESETDTVGSDDGEAEGIEKEEKSSKKPEGLKVKGELGLEDLPPIEDLHISVPHDEAKPIGIIKSVVEPLVIVEAYLETPALDLDSVLFLDEGDRALGRIFDVIGPVKQPLYCVRFNSREHIEKNKIEIGLPVFCAPKSPYTSYVFLAQLRKLKGTDASWLNDHEPPAEEIDYSDDEMERMSKSKKKNRRKFPNRPATEEDATYKEDNENTGSGVRGKKRHHINGDTVVANPAAPYHPNMRPPFMPPMVPGFTPYGPPNYYNGFPYPGQGPWQPRPGGPRHRGGRGYHHRPRHHANRPPPSAQYPPAYAYPQNPTPDAMQWRPWCPPLQWEGQQFPNVNFGGAPNPYRAQYVAPPPPPPPPSEPSPPGQ